jgi:hypothetical protein
MSLKTAARNATQSAALKIKLTNIINANEIYKNKILFVDFHECET